MQVIILEQTTDPEIFVSYIKQELGQTIEYIQPDYKLELSDLGFELDGTQAEPRKELEQTEDKPETEQIGKPIDRNTELTENENDGLSGLDDSSARQWQYDDDDIDSLASYEEKANGEKETDQSKKQQTEALSDKVSGPQDKNKDKIDQDNQDDGDNKDNKNKEVEQGAKDKSGDITGAGVIIAVIATGIATSHPMLKDNIIDGYDFVNGKAEVYNAESGLDQAHGTHTAGIIAQTAPVASIMPLKVFENGVAYKSDIIAAIEYAKANGANIVNCSWDGADNNPALLEAIQK